VGARYGYNNKGSHEEASVIERSILETRRHLTPILETLLEEFGNQEDWFMETAIAMVQFLFNNLPTHRGPSPTEILMPLFSNPNLSLIQVDTPGPLSTYGTELVELQLRVLQAVLKLEQAHQAGHLKDAPLLHAPDLGTLVLVDVGYAKEHTRYVGPFVVELVHKNFATIKSCMSEGRYKIHLSKLKRYYHDTRNDVPEVVASRDYGEALVVAIEQHRVEGAPNLVDSYVFEVRFLRHTQWLPYATVKHLTLLEAYVRARPALLSLWQGHLRVPGPQPR
jgi:hypothetical protein